MREEFKPGELNRRDGDRMRRYRELLDFYQAGNVKGEIVIIVEGKK